MIGDNSAGRLKSIVERIERVEADIKDMNTDKSEIYKEARGAGFDVKVMREVIKRRRLDASELDERESLIDTYFAALGTTVATRARTKTTPHDPDTGEITESPCELTQGPSETVGEIPCDGDASLPPSHREEDAPLRPASNSQPEDTRHLTPNDILGDEPIPQFLKRAAE